MIHKSTFYKEYFCVVSFLPLFLSRIQILLNTTLYREEKVQDEAKARNNTARKLCYFKYNCNVRGIEVNFQKPKTKIFSIKNVTV